MKKISILTIIIILIACFPAISQKFLEPRLQYGGFIYLDFNHHNVDIPTCPEDTIIGLNLVSSNGIGTTFGGLIDIPLNKDFAIIIKPSYFNQSGIFKFDGNGIRTINGVPTNATVKVNMDGSIHTAGIEALASAKIYKDLSFQIGLRGDYVYRNYMVTEEFLEKPEQGTYPNGKRSQVLYDGDIYCINSVSTSLVAGLSYEIPLNYKRTIRIAPELSFAYRFNSFTKDESWNMYAIRIGASIKFSTSKELDISLFPKEQNIKAYEYELCGSDKAYLSSPDIVKYNINTNSDAGIKSWEYAVIQKDIFLDSMQSPNEPPENISWKIYDNNSKRFHFNSEQAKYIVTIFDKAGQSVADTSIIKITPSNAELTAEISIFDKNRKNKLDSLLVEDLSSCQKESSSAYPDVIFINSSTSSLGQVSNWKLTVTNNGKPLFDTTGIEEVPKEIAFRQQKILNWLPQASTVLTFQLEIKDSYNNICNSNILKIPFNRNKYELKTELKAYEQNYGDTSNQNKPLASIGIIERNSTRMQPLLNYIFFDENSSEIPKRYKKLQWQQTKEFTLDLLHQSSILETYYNILNIVAKRLVMYPNAKLNILGCNSNINTEKDNLELSQKRAEAIRDYFRDVWSISEDRLILQSRNAPLNPSLKQQKDPQDKEDAIAEDRRVELYCDTYEVLDPVLTTGVRYEVTPDKVLLKPEVKNDADITNWYIIFETENNNYVISPRANTIPDRIDWDLDNLKKAFFKSEDKKGIIQMSVTDSKEQQCLYELPVNLNKSSIQDRVMLGIDTTYDEYSLILFDFDSYKIEGLNKRIIDFIRGKVNHGAVIEISGFTDRIGTSEYNLTLSTRRAENSKKELNLLNQKVTAIGLGESGLYDNNNPEGRFYCRTVNISVKNPVKTK